MKFNFQSLKNDLYNVFVMGNADNRQLLRVYLLVTIPCMSLFYALADITI